MAIQSIGSVTLVDLTDAVSVTLELDSHVWSGTTTGVAGTQNVTTRVMAIQGDKTIACTIGDIAAANKVNNVSTIPNGLTASVVNESPVPLSPALTIQATSSLTTSGTLTIPVLIGDLTINKKFSWSISKTGQTGATGNGVSSVASTYQASANGTTVPTGAWSSSIPAVPKGQYLWTKKETTFTNGAKTQEYSVGYMGTDGANGSNGRGISSTAVTYVQSTSGTTTPSSGWASTVPTTLNKGQYLWTRTVTTYTDNTSSTSYSVAYNGQDGAKGADGKNGTNGTDAYNLVISSSGGMIFKNTGVSTTLTAHVFKGATELTGSALTAAGTIKWYKNNETTPFKIGVESIVVDDTMVDNQATFTAKLEQ